MKTKVKICTSIGKRKEYCIPILKKILPLLSENPKEDCIIAWDGVPCDNSVPGLHIEIPTTDKVSRVTRLAYMRSLSRQAALEDKDATHFYWHDSDMIPDSNTIKDFLALNLPVVSGIYPVRFTQEPVLLPMLDIDGPNNDNVVTIADTSVIKTTKNYVHVDGFGQGCMLIRRDVFAAVNYRAPGYYAKNGIGEDYRWCLDAKQRFGVDITVRLDNTPWHCDSEGGNRLVIGDSEPSATFKGSTNMIATNDFGIFYLNSPRYDLTKRQLDTLSESPFFDVGYTSKIVVERKELRVILEAL